MRQPAFDRRPTILDDIGLAAALERLAASCGTRMGLPVELSIAGLDDDRRLSGDLETVVYRIVQESLTNVARHANATAASVAAGATGYLIKEATDLELVQAAHDAGRLDEP